MSKKHCFRKSNVIQKIKKRWVKLEISEKCTAYEHQENKLYALISQHKIQYTFPFLMLSR